MSTSYVLNDASGHRNGGFAQTTTTTTTTTTNTTHKKTWILQWIDSFKRKDKSAGSGSQSNLLQNGSSSSSNLMNLLNMGPMNLQEDDEINSNSSLSYTSETSSDTQSPPTSPPTLTSISPLSNSAQFQVANHLINKGGGSSTPNSNTSAKGGEGSTTPIAIFSIEPPIPFPVYNSNSSTPSSPPQTQPSSASPTPNNNVNNNNKGSCNSPKIGKAQSFNTSPNTKGQVNMQLASAPDRDMVPIIRETRATKENFYKMIEDPKQFSKFKSYMENYQSMENLNFYLEIERYKKIPREDERRYAANDIWRRFFVEDGSSQLNLESALKKRVELAMKGEPIVELFDEVENQVLEDMVCDAYLHFLKSPFNQEWRVQPNAKPSMSTSTSNNNISEQTTQQNIVTSPVCQSQPIHIPTSPSNINNNINNNNHLNNNNNTVRSPTQPTSPIQLSISICASDNPETCQITKIDASDIEYILDEVMKNNITIHNEINYQDVLISHWLASGASGRVYLGYWKGKEVAVKIFGHEFNVYFDVAEYRREVALMTILKHDSLVQCFGSGSYGNSYFHLTEYCPKGSLTDYLKNPLNIMDMQAKIGFALDIAYGMKYLHSMSIIHRDLKSMNILISDNNKIKIIDFGSSRITNKYMTSHVGTQAWMAPEIFTSKHYTDKVDVYSYGVILWEIFTRRAPYEENVPFNVPLLVAKGERPDLPAKEFPSPIANLIKKCWSHKPGHRPSFVKICAYLESLNESIKQNSGKHKFVAQKI